MKDVRLIIQKCLTKVICKSNQNVLDNETSCAHFV